MIDIVKKNQQAFVDEQKKIVQIWVDAQIEKIWIEWPMIKDVEEKELLKKLLEFHETYKEGTNQGITETAEYIQFSFLRTSLVDTFPYYRIDLYDQRWYASSWECCLYWNPEFVFGRLGGIKNELVQRFCKQTCAPLYFVDELIRWATDQIQEQFLNLLADMVLDIVKEKKFIESFGNKMKLLGGEFLDQSWMLYDGGNL